MSVPLFMQLKHGFGEENNLVVPQGWGVAQWKSTARMYKVLGSIHESDQTLNLEFSQNAASPPQGTMLAHMP